jgi:TonB family protein
MANKDDKDKATKPAESPELDLVGGEFLTYAAEDSADRKAMRYALGVAIVLHAALFIIKFSEGPANAGEAKKQKVYVVQQVRFRPPPPEQKQEIPKARSKKVPIPDPTPDEPEPIRLEEEIEQEIELPTDDIVFGIPEGPPPSEPTGPIHVGGDMNPPEKISAPQPQYTEIARKARIQGVVIVQAIIDKTGAVTSVKLLKGLPMGLDQAALDAIKRWQFKPATLSDGRPVSVYYTLTVNFQLQ